MQHYLDCGIGFDSDLISKEDWEKFSNLGGEKLISLDVSEDSFAIVVVPNVEDSFNIEEAHGSSAIVFRNSKSAKKMQKMFSFEDVDKFKKAYFPLNNSNKEKILDELKKYGLEKYVDAVDVIVYSYCC